MPLDKYFSGSGEKVMHAMKKTYGKDKGKQVFYATANKQDKKPAAHVSELARKGKKHK